MISNATYKCLLCTLLRPIERSREGVCIAICTIKKFISDNSNIVFIWSI